MIPLLTKFNSNAVLYDSLGDSANSYISFSYNKNSIYFLKDTNGTVLKYAPISETYTQLSANKAKSTSIVYSILEYKDTVYAFEGYDAKSFTPETVLYVKNNNLLVQESFDRKLNVVHLSSFSGIRDFFVDEDLNYYVVHAKNKISKFTKERILVYSMQIVPSTSNIFYSLSVLPNNEIEILKLDFIREYTDSGLKRYPVILGKIKDNSLFLGKIDETTKEVTSASFIGLTGRYYEFGHPSRINYNLTNYNYLKNTYQSTSSIVFKTVLQNVFNNKDIIKVEIPVPTSYFKSEYHHFAYRLDGINGEISLFCDSKLISSVKISPGQYIFQDIFNDSFSVGNTYFYNSVTLPKYLQQPLYYHINNAKIKQFKLYNKALTQNEIQLLAYNNLLLDDLVVSIPCDQRNELDSIERYFKIDTGGHKSNKVNIIVKNSQITNNSLQEKLKTIIADNIKSVIPATTTINNIEFR